ncbi:hypothetical protein HYH03_014963 [Edaphochlamys debaryana]|uniref:Protein kinase domain-containing protein n=1 Tax=Edaphochlamys debaryana TaxID=47281 RepID=A0A835XP59_9CHLO|nr:hypothetical protein HYH03_014963 [Edaphochlamys debaryana]|eukprot:KAG2486383.1 hypothetical protein HYH03_014963 [Edaphochlamys debaryana]
MGLFSCFGGAEEVRNTAPTAAKPAQVVGHAPQPNAQPTVPQPAEPRATPARSDANGEGKGILSFSRGSLGRLSAKQATADRATPAANGIHADSDHTAPEHEALLTLLTVLTSLDGGWWEQIERAAIATAQHLTANHACIFLISGDNGFASPLALAGPAAPPLCVGVPMLMSAPGPSATGMAPAGPASAAAANPAGTLAPAASAPVPGSPPSAGPGPGLPALGPSCAAAALIAEQLHKDPGRLLCFLDSPAPASASAKEVKEGREGKGGPLLPPASPPEWRHLAYRAGQRHFAAVGIPAGSHTVGVLALGAEGACRPPCWRPESLHAVAALLSAPLRTPQVDLASRALGELSGAGTIHALVRVVLGAAAELVLSVTHVETQARVAFLPSDVEAAAVFQSAATDLLGPAVRRRLSEVLLVDTSAVGGGGGGGGQGGGGARGAASGAPTRRSLGGNEGLVASRVPSAAAAFVDGARDSFAERGSLYARGGHGGDELSVCRGHSLPLKHTLLSEALSHASGLCISDCNAYVQDSKVYPRDLAVSRGAAPAQSLALASGSHEGRPLLALYATYHSVLPQGLLQAVVQELGQLLKALTPTVAAKLAGPLAAEWGYLKHQLMESMRNRSLRSLVGSNAQSQVIDPTAAAAAVDSAPGAAASGIRTGASGGLAAADSPANAASAVASASAAAAGVNTTGGGGTGLMLSAMSAAAAVLTEGSGSQGLLGFERSRGKDGRASGRASFSLEAANSPRGSSKLAPLIATLHDRLKAAQAEQMANCRAASRVQDLESIRILEQIGRGGYGVVYRGLYHGSEVAIKVIQEAEVAAAAGDDGGPAGPLRRMNSVALENKHLHDAIELVASVGMGGHPNIVQVLTFFTDVRVMVGDQPVDGLQRRLSGLDGVAELMRLTHMPGAVAGPLGGGGGGQAAPGSGAGGESGTGDAAESGEVGGGSPRSSGVIVLVQEFCDAGTLKNAINQRAFFDRGTVQGGPDRPSRVHLQLNMRAVYSTLLEVALALRHMHGLHMVHCDLKPQNVLLKSSPRDPRGFTAKLSDFGLAKMMAHDEDGQLVIDEAVGSGTLTHMAPESLAGQKQLNASIDVFSFGILMWQMLCGTRLYQGLTTKQIIRGVVREGLRPQFPAWVPPEYRRLAERCWHPTPSERPTAGAIVAELESMVDTHSRSHWRSWRGPGAPGGGGGGGGGGGLADSPMQAPARHAAAAAAQLQLQAAAAAGAGAGGGGGAGAHPHVAQVLNLTAIAAAASPAPPAHAPGSGLSPQGSAQAPQRQHHAAPETAQPRGPGGNGPGRPQGGNTGGGAGPSLLII